MAKNKLTDLNDHLFAQLERLGDEDLKGDALAEEISRSKALTAVAAQIISNGSLLLQATKAASDGYVKEKIMPRMLGGGDGSQVHA